MNETAYDSAAPLAEWYGLNWVGKAQALQELQQPATATLIPDRAGSVHFDTAEHVVIEGENLEALRVLQKSYYGQIGLIYIDPPYNTGNDSFLYPDDYAEGKQAYAARAGLTDAHGDLRAQAVWQKNSVENGRFHSVWLSMMYPRLALARNLLREDGVMFVSIDDHEYANLKLLLDEIFGAENYRNTIIIKRGAKNVQMQFATVDKLGSGYEYLLFYTKNAEQRFPHLKKKLATAKEGCWNNHWRGTDRPTMRYELWGMTPATGQWRWSQARSLNAAANYQRMLAELGKPEADLTPAEIDAWYLRQDAELDLLRLSKHGKPEHYIPPTDAQLVNDVWFDIPPNSTRTLTALFNGKAFDNPKPLDLITRCLDFTAPDALVLDFFAGSGTTGHAVLASNRATGAQRKFILVQMAEPLPAASDAAKLGFATIAQLTRARLQRVCAQLNAAAPNQETTAPVGFKAFIVGASHCKSWDAHVQESDAVLTQLAEFTESVRPAPAESLLFELLLQFGYPLHVPIHVWTVDGSPVFGINQETVALFAKASRPIADFICQGEFKTVICLDRLFANDEAKINFSLQLQDAQIALITL